MSFEIENVNKRRGLDISNLECKNNSILTKLGMDGVLMQYICIIGNIYLWCASCVSNFTYIL